MGRACNCLEAMRLSLMTPELTGRRLLYLILQVGNELGRGSFGIVYRAKWNGAPVAVKVRTGGTTSAQFMPLCP